MSCGVGTVADGREGALAGQPAGLEERCLAAMATEWQAQMMRMALRYVDDPEIAQEVVQETWLAALRQLATFAGRATFKSWLLAILLNRARSRGKIEQRQRRLLVSTEELVQAEEQAQPAYGFHRTLAAPEALLLRAEFAHELEMAINDLPAQQRAVLILHDVEGMSAAEICTHLQLSEANQRVLLHRARQRLRQVLTHHGAPVE